MTVKDEAQKYQIALSLIEGVGDILGKKLLAQCGSAQEVFYSEKSRVTKIKGIHKNFTEARTDKQILLRAKQEVEWMNKKGIHHVFYSEKKISFPAETV